MLKFVSGIGSGGVARIEMDLLSMIVVRRAQWGSMRAVSLIAGGELSTFSQVLDFDQIPGAMVDQSLDSL